MTADQLANHLIDQDSRCCDNRVLARQMFVSHVLPAIPESGDLYELGKRRQDIKAALVKRATEGEYGISPLVMMLIAELIVQLIKWWLAQNRKAAIAALKGVRA